MEEQIIDNRPTRAQSQDQLLREAMSIFDAQNEAGFVPHDPVEMRLDDEGRIEAAEAFEAREQNPWNNQGPAVDAVPDEAAEEQQPPDPPPPPTDSRSEEGKWRSYLFDDDTVETSVFGFSQERHENRKFTVVSSSQKPAPQYDWWMSFTLISLAVLCNGLLERLMCGDSSFYHRRAPSPIWEAEEDPETFHNLLNILKAVLRLLPRLVAYYWYHFSAALVHFKTDIYRVFDAKVIHDACPPGKLDNWVITWLLFFIVALYLRYRAPRSAFITAPRWWRLTMACIFSGLGVILVLSARTTLSPFDATPHSPFKTINYFRWTNYAAFNTFTLAFMVFYQFIFFWPRVFWRHSVVYRSWIFSDESKYDTNSKGESLHMDPKLGMHTIHKVWGWTTFRKFISTKTVSVELAVQACNPSSMSLLSDRNTSIERLDRFINTNQTVNVPRYSMLDGEHVYQNSLLLAAAFRDSYELSREGEFVLDYDRPP